MKTVNHTLKVVFYLIVIFVLNTASAQTNKLSWKKYGMDNTQLYFFRLPSGINPNLIKARVVHQQSKKLDEQMHLNGMAINRKNEFTYIAAKTNSLYGQKLPFYLPANIWVYAFNYSDQFILVDDAIKIKLSSDDKNLFRTWQLPETFDMRSDLALSINEYKSKSEQILNANYITTLSLQKIKTKEIAIADTSLVFSLKRLPKGLLLILKGLNLIDHANQEFVVNALWYKEEFFFYVPENKIQPSNKPDQCFGKMTDINGNIGFASGCITGMGSGKCMGILKPNASKKYSVTLIIEPN
jgi:hypothetical protein